MFKKSMMLLFLVMLMGTIIVCGDDETRDYLKQKLKKA